VDIGSDPTSAVWGLAILLALASVCVIAAFRRW
jgi:hypothetical protein